MLFSCFFFYLLKNSCLYLSGSMSPLYFQMVDMDICLRCRLNTPQQFIYFINTADVIVWKDGCKKITCMHIITFFSADRNETFGDIKGSVVPLDIRHANFDVFITLRKYLPAKG